MSQTKRQALKRGDITLYGEGDDKRFPRTFHISRAVATGSTAICYEASYQGDVQGVLKEYYPRGVSFLGRAKNGQVIPQGKQGRELWGQFLEEQDKYAACYRKLQELKKADPGSNLDSFIPNVEIYYGDSEEGASRGTVYIWTSQPKLETFDKICGNICRRPNYKPEYRLVQVLSALERLTECVGALHKAGLIHRDIKPSNFGFVKKRKKGEDILTDTLTMFDFDTICEAGRKETVGTPGYMEPEAGRLAANNQTDIYSIGATLFSAIIVEEGKTGIIYKQEDFDQLDKKVDNSLLIRASEVNSHPRLRYCLTKILKKCLAERRGSDGKKYKRYNNCEELLEDLREALYYVLPASLSDKTRRDIKWELKEAETSLDRHGERNSALAIQYHLYQEPLYRPAREGDKYIDVLVLGFGNYGQKFLDRCLQAGQICGKQLRVIVVSQDPMDYTIYLEQRPELKRFFKIDGGAEGLTEEDYGYLHFETQTLSGKREKADEDILLNIMCEYGDKSQYIFIALGNDTLNLNVAKTCKKIGDESQYCINYVVEDESEPKSAPKQMNPVYVNRNVKKSCQDYDEIERMAFNIHLLWEKSQNPDYKLVRREFRAQYNYEACISNALFLKYKLYSAGIEFPDDRNTRKRTPAKGSEKAAAARAAASFAAAMENSSFRDEMIYMEHRRWVTEKICAGWTTLELSQMKKITTSQDKEHKRHICIRRSRADQLLAGYPVEYWDDMTQAELEALDELDRMSVELHRKWKARANSVKEQNLLSEANLVQIRDLIRESIRVKDAFQEWYLCAKDIWNGNRHKVNLYKGLKNAVIDAAETLPTVRRDGIKSWLDTFDGKFGTVLSSLEYRNYKQEDVAIIDNVPFILTYSTDIRLAVPFTMGSSDAVFRNIAAASVVNPGEMIYLCYLESPKQMEDISTAVSSIARYIASKSMQASVSYVVAYRADQWGDVASKLRAVFGRPPKLIPVKSFDEACAGIQRYLKRRSAGEALLALERNDSELSVALERSELCRQVPSYRFDLDSMKFQTSDGCVQLTYVNRSPYLTVEDILRFRNTDKIESEEPEFFDNYQELWERYSKGTGTWKALCRSLLAHVKEADKIAGFSPVPMEKKNVNMTESQYLFPAECFSTLKDLIGFLKGTDCIGEDSRVFTRATSLCVVRLVTTEWNHQKFEKLIPKADALAVPGAIKWYSVKRKEDGAVVEAVVKYDNLVITNARLDTEDETKFIRQKHLLRFFEEKNYITMLPDKDQNPGTVSFVCTTRQVKGLLTAEGKILEIYAYHKAKELGEFDDVAGSVSIEWGENRTENELDGILTKGFRSLILECKATNNLEREFYEKLDREVKGVGVNARAILLVDSYPIQRDGGPDPLLWEGTDVITIWKKNEVENIGETLLGILNNEYTPQ